MIIRNRIKEGIRIITILAVAVNMHVHAVNTQAEDSNGSYKVEKNYIIETTEIYEVKTMKYRNSPIYDLSLINKDSLNGHITSIEYSILYHIKTNSLEHEGKCTSSELKVEKDNILTKPKTENRDIEFTSVSYYFDGVNERALVGLRCQIESQKQLFFNWVIGLIQEDKKWRIIDYKDDENLLFIEKSLLNGS